MPRLGERQLAGAGSYSPSRPQPAGRGYVSIFAGGAPGDRVEWPVFGEQIDDLTAATRPQPVVAASKDPNPQTAVTSSDTRRSVLFDVELLVGLRIRLRLNETAHMPTFDSQMP